MINNIHKFIKKTFINNKDNILKFCIIYYKGKISLVDERLKPCSFGQGLKPPNIFQAKMELKNVKKKKKNLI